MNRARRILTAVVAALSMTFPIVAQAAPSDDDVVEAVTKAAGHVEQGRYEKALAVLDAAERKNPHPVFIFVRATIEEQRGDCQRAAELYRQYIERDDVPEADAKEAHAGETRCREALGLPPFEPEPDPESEVEAETGAETETGPEDQPAPWHTDPLGGALVAGGIVGVGVGLGLFIQSRADERAANGASSLQIHQDRGRRAARLNVAGITVMAIGSALLVGGAVRYVLVARSRRTVAWSPMWSRHGGGVQATIHF